MNLLFLKEKIKNLKASITEMQAKELDLEAAEIIFSYTKP